MVDADSQEPERAEAHVPERLDPAGKSLADALRVSFRLLTFIMAGLFVLFLGSGTTCIGPDEVGIKKTFGRVVGVAEEGLTYTWPFPVGEIDKVQISIKTLRIDDFWMHETPEDKTMRLSERSVPRVGLRPGWDGALLTGDRNLLHVGLGCTYRVGDALVYRECFGAGTDAKGPPEAETIRSVVCSAVIHASADKTAAGLYNNLDAFVRDVERDAQRQLDELTGTAGTIVIEAISPEESSWPLGARSAYRAVQEAVQQGQQKRNKAISDARETLTEVASNYTEFVGSPWEAGAGRPDPDAPPDAKYNLIRQYEQAGADDEAAGILKQINELLGSGATKGQASQIIAEADAQRFVTVQRVERRARAFEELLPGFRKTPQLLLERQWAETLEEVLGSRTVEKIVLSVRNGRVIIRTGQDPGIARSILRERLRNTKEQEKAGK